MIYLFENPNNDASVVYDESSLSTGDKAKGVAVESLPLAGTPEGKVALLKVKKSTGEVWWEYKDAPISPVDELSQLKANQLSLQEAVDFLVTLSM